MSVSAAMLLNIQSGASPWSGCTGVFAAVIREILPDLRTSFRGISMQEVEIITNERENMMFAGEKKTQLSLFLIAHSFCAGAATGHKWLSVASYFL